MVTATGCALNFVNSPQSDRLVADHRRSWRRIYLEYEPAATELASVRLPRLFTPALATATQRHPATGRYQAAAHLTSQLSTPLAATISMVATKAFPSDLCGDPGCRRSDRGSSRQGQHPDNHHPRRHSQPHDCLGRAVAEPRTAPATRLRPQLRDERAIQRCTRRSTTVNPSTTPTPHTRPLGTAGRARRRPSGPRATPTTRHPQPFLAPTGSAPPPRCGQRARARPRR